MDGPMVDSVLERTPPANIDAERAVLGAVLLDPTTMTTIVDLIGRDDFYREAHKHVYDAICRLYERNVDIDPLTLSEELRTLGQLDRVGGLPYLSELAGAVPATSAIEHYGRIVHEKALIRRMIYAAGDILEMGYEGTTETKEFLDQAEKWVFSVREGVARDRIVPVSKALKDALENMQRLYEQQAGITGIPTGFEKFDGMTMGLQRSDLIILAARPAMGKTTFALNIASNAALQANAAVLLFSLEMGADQLVTRLLSAEARVELTKLRSGQLADRDWHDVANAAGRLAEAKIFIDETPAISPLEIRARARRKKRDGQLDLIVIDYLQLMSAGRNIQSREQQISEISRSLKELARELSVPVIALSQLNRGLESRTDKRPMMSDLRESGAIEQDADIIIFIYRDEIYNPETPDRGVAEVIIGKHRNGPTGKVRVKFFNAFTRFENLYEEAPPPGIPGA